MTRPLVIFHANCADGFTAAWVCWKFFQKEVDFHPGIYADRRKLPDVTGRDVIMVDFSYPRAVIEELAVKARSILILDHHVSAQADLSGFDIPEHLLPSPGIQPWLPDSGVYALFDMKRSGCMIAWDYFYPGKRPPKVLEHIQDRDLWLFKLEGTEEIQANIFSYPYEFDVWDKLMYSKPAELRVDGVPITRKHLKDIAEFIVLSKRTMVIGGHKVPVANFPYTMASDAANKMAREFDALFAATYWDGPKGRTFSLRSIAPDGIDVAAIASNYGGGGHKHASGFTVPIGWEGDADETGQKERTAYRKEI